jgi:GMP synthase PP-ATPase subunit
MLLELMPEISLSTTWRVFLIRRKSGKVLGRILLMFSRKEAKKLKDVHWLAQGTIYPDVIESVSVNGPSVTIKSHHNVGGLPEKMHLKVVEPLRLLFKDEVRRVGKATGDPLIFPEATPISRARTWNPDSW